MMFLQWFHILTSTWSDHTLSAVLIFDFFVITRPGMHNAWKIRCPHSLAAGFSQPDVVAGFFI